MAERLNASVLKTDVLVRVPGVRIPPPPHFYFSSMSYFVYILYSNSIDSFYKGQTNDISQRLLRHNAGYEKYTQKGIPWMLIWTKNFDTRSEAVILETKLKNLTKSKLKSFISKYHEFLQIPKLEFDSLFNRGS